MTNNENKPDSISNKDEINLVELILGLWSYRIIIFKISAVSFLLGLLIVIGTPREYKSEITVVIESEDQSSSLIQQFAGLAGLAGINAGGNEDALTPEMYPDIISSNIFLLEIMNIKVTDKSGKQFLVYDYQNKKKKSLLGFIVNIPAKLIRIISRDTLEPFQDYNFNNHIIKLTKAEADQLDNLRNSINVEISKSSKGLLGKASINPLRISVNQQDPFIAKQLTDSIVTKLSKFIIEYRTNKARIDLSFIFDRSIEAKKQFLEVQDQLASLKDKNKDIISSKVQSDLDRLQSDYNLKFNTYNNLSIQLEQAKIKVQQNSPALQIIEPSEIPYKKDKPKTLITVFVLTFIGFFMAITYIIFGKILFKEIIEKFKQSK